MDGPASWNSTTDLEGAPITVKFEVSRLVASGVEARPLNEGRENEGLSSGVLPRVGGMEAKTGKQIYITFLIHIFMYHLDFSSGLRTSQEKQSACTLLAQCITTGTVSTWGPLRHIISPFEPSSPIPFPDATEGGCAHVDLRF